MKTFTVGVFEHERKRSVQLAAYTRYYSPQWQGCCEHTVDAQNGTDAKERAKAEHRARCMQRNEPPARPVNE